MSDLITFAVILGVALLGWVCGWIEGRASNIGKDKK